MTSPRSKKSAANAGPSASERLVRVEERLESMERTNAAGLNNVAERLKELHTCVDRIEQRIEANMHGDQARPGIVVRVDRLEQAHERSRWLFRLIIGAVITLSVGAVFALLKS